MARKKSAAVNAYSVGDHGRKRMYVKSVKSQKKGGPLAVGVSSSGKKMTTFVSKKKARELKSKLKKMKSRSKGKSPKRKSPKRKSLKRKSPKRKSSKGEKKSLNRQKRGARRSG